MSNTMKYILLLVVVIVALRSPYIIQEIVHGVIQIFTVKPRG